jgi:hypothetical protein
LGAGGSCHCQSQQGNTRDVKQTFHFRFLLSDNANSEAAATVPE